MIQTKKNIANTTLFRLLSFVPTIALLCLIFGFSAQDSESSGSLSFRVSLCIVELIDPVLPTSASENILYQRAELIHLFVRKVAHMTEYFLLALSIQLPLFTCFSKKLNWKIRLFAGFFLTVGFAALDEYHQTFVPGRSGNLTDVGIDSIGAVIASLLLFIFYMIYQTHKQHQSKR